MTSPIRTWIGFVFMCIGMFMAVLDISVVGSSLTNMQSALKIPIDDLSWIQTAYLTAEVIAIPMTGWLTRAVSLRWMFVAATAGFTLASLGCALSNSEAPLDLLYPHLLAGVLPGWSSGLTDFRDLALGGGTASWSCADASKISLHWPQRTQPSEMRSWSGTTLNIVLQAGQRVIRLMACDCRVPHPESSEAGRHQDPALFAVGHVELAVRRIGRLQFVGLPLQNAGQHQLPARRDPARTAAAPAPSAAWPGYWPAPVWYCPLTWSGKPALS